MLYYRCQSGYCMPTAWECVSCQEVHRVGSRINTTDSEPSCIIEHESFHQVGLNIFWVLQIAQFYYRQPSRLAKLVPFHLISIKKKYFDVEVIMAFLLFKACRQVTR